MEQLGTFVMNHWILFLALVVISTMLATSLLKAKLIAFKEVKPVEMVELMNRQDAVVLDVREEQDFKKAHILNAMHIPFDSLEERHAELDDYKSRPIVVYCRAGQESTRAADMLKKQGFESIYKLSGGILSWQGAGMPVTSQS